MADFIAEQADFILFFYGLASSCSESRASPSRAMLRMVSLGLG
jgi:hypothetical protein